jgi:RNA-binding protein
MTLSNADKKTLRGIGHRLQPVVTVAGKGLSESVDEALEIALTDHELLKVKLAIDDRALRRSTLRELCARHEAELVQEIGKVALIYRRNPDADPRKSNLARHPV